MPNQNLVLYSEQFDNAAWTKVNGASIAANAVAAPDGASTADALTASTAHVNTYISQTYTIPVLTERGSPKQYTFSVWLRADSACSLNLECDDGIGTPSSQVTCALTTSWQRFRVTVTTVSTTTVVFAAIGGGAIFPTARTIYAWGAQLEQSNAAGEYVATTSAIVNAGAPANKRLSQNLMAFSEQADNAGWTKTNSSITANAATAPNGTATMDKLVEDTSTATHRISQTVTIGPGRLVFSEYVQAAGRTKILISLGDNIGGVAEVIFDLSAVSYTITQVTNVIGLWTNVVAAIVSVGGGTYRISVAATKGGASTNVACLTYLYTSTHSYLGDGSSGVYLWGAQLEQSDAPGEYVATTASAVNQNASMRKRLPQQLILQSENFATTWTNSCGTSTSGQTDRAGGSTAWLLGDTSAAAFQSITQTISIPQDTATYCVAVLVKKDASATAACGINLSMTGGTTVARSPRMSPVDGTLFGTDANSVDLGAWILFWCVITNNGGNSTFNISFFPATGALPPSSGDVVTGQGSVTIDDFRVTKGSYPGEYIATTTAALNIGTPANTRRPQNYVLNSNDINAIATSKINCTTAKNAVDPFGVSSSATTMTDSVDGAPTSHNLNSIVATNVTAALKPSGMVWTYSLFVKAGTKSKVALAPGAGSWVAYFDLATGLPGTLSGSGAITSRCTACAGLGAGWFRCSITFSATAAQLAFMNDNRIYMVTADGSLNYQGDGTGTLILFGAQVEQSDAPGDYLPTLTSSVGLPSVMPNAPRRRGRQNLWLYSEQFDNAQWTKGNSTITANAATAPDGNVTADRFNEAVDAGLRYHYVLGTHQTFPIGTIVTYSVFAKAGTKNYVSIYPEDADFGGVWWDLTTGLVAGTALSTNVVSYGSKLLANGWGRYWVTSKWQGNTGGLANGVIYMPNDAAFASNQGDGTGNIYIWGAQLEQSNAPGEYIVASSAVFNPHGAPRKYRTAA